MALIYHSADPEANKEVFREFDSVDFVIQTDRNLVGGSVRIEGDLRVLQTGSTRAEVIDGIHLNKRIGAHALIEGLQIQVNGNTVENISSDYSRFVHMVQSATKSVDDYFDSNELCELKAPSVDVANGYCSGHMIRHLGGDGVPIDLDFSIRPLCCLNRMSDNLQMSRVGNSVRLSLNLARNTNALQGLEQINDTSYELRNLRLTYRTVEPQSVPSVMCSSVVPIKHVLNSSFSNVSSRVPAVVNAVSASFLKLSKENQLKTDNNSLEVPPDLQEVQFLFNNSTNQLTQYVLDDYGQFLDGYLSSLKNYAGAEVSPNNVKGNSVFGVGVDFNDDVDLTNEKFGIQVKSEVSSTNNYLMYLYFHTKFNL